MRIVLDMVVISFESLEQEFMFGMTNGFDDETVVSGEIEKRT